LYGLCKKMVRIDSLVALGIETLLLAPIALGYLLINQGSFRATMSNAAPLTVVLLTLSGIFTALPLLWFARAARLVPLSVLGFTQYLSPTITLLLGIYLFREPFSLIHGASFGLIWIGLIIFSFVQARKINTSRKEMRRNKGEI